MTPPSPSRTTRAPRVNMRGSVTVLVQLENLRRIPAKLYQLSTTGGLLEIPMYQEERAKVGLTIPLNGNVLRPRAEMLFPMKTARGYSQPFRFTFIQLEEHQILQKEIAEILKQDALPPSRKPADGFRHPRFYLESF